MSIRRSLLVLTFLTFALPVVVFAYTAYERTNAAAANDFSNLEFYAVSRGRVEAVVSAIGTIEADQVVNLSFLTAGQVAEVLVKSGDTVLAGDALVGLNATQQQLVYEQALIARDRAQLSLDDLLAPVDEDEIRLAEAEVDSAWGNYLSIENAVTDEDLRAAELAYEQVQQIYEGLKAARDQAPGGYGSPTYNTLDAQTGAASFNAEIARLQLDSLRNGTGPQLNAAYARVVQAQRELDRVKAGPSPFQIDAAALAVRRAEIQVTRSETDLNRMTLTAPFDGVVSSVFTETGALVTPGLTVLELTDISPLRLTVQVDEIDISLIEVGMPAWVEFDALPNVVIPAWLEKISFVGANVNGIVSYDVDFALETDDPRVRVGMTAEANIIVDEQDDTVIVPNLYVRLDRRRDQAFVNVLRDNGAIEEVEVVLGLQGQDESEVVSGLSEGDIIVVDPTGERFSLFGE